MSTLFFKKALFLKHLTGGMFVLFQSIAFLDYEVLLHSDINLSLF